MPVVAVVAAYFHMFGSSSLESKLIYKLQQLLPPSATTHNHGWRPLGKAGIIPSEAGHQKSAAAASVPYQRVRGKNPSNLSG
jgi:hypothetical protein